MRTSESTSTVTISQPLDPVALPQASYVTHGIPQLRTIFPDAHERLHRGLALVKIAEIALAGGLSHEFGNRRPLSLFSLMKRLPQLIIEV